MPLSTQNLHHFRLYPQTILNLYTSDLQQDDEALTTAHRNYLLFISHVIEANAQTLAAPHAAWHTADADLNHEMTAELAGMLTNPTVFQDANLLAADLPEVRFTVLSQLAVPLFQAQRASPAELDRCRQALSQFYTALPEHVMLGVLAQASGENPVLFGMDLDRFARQLVRLAPLAFLFIAMGFYQAIVPMFDQDNMLVQRELMKAIQKLQQAHDPAQLQALQLQRAQFMAEFNYANRLLAFSTGALIAWTMLVANYRPAAQRDDANPTPATRPRLASWPAELGANPAEAADDHNRQLMRP